MSRHPLRVAGWSLALAAATGAGGPTTVPSTSPATPPVYVFKAADPAHLRFALVTFNDSSFWRECRPGIERFEQESGSRVDLVMPEVLTAAGQDPLIAAAAPTHDGVAVAPMGKQMDAINAAAARTNVVCMFSDSPMSDRLAFVGVDNVAAGEQVGRELVKLMPHGGRVGLFAGYFDMPSAADRVKGIERAIAGHGLTIAMRSPDGLDEFRAEADVEDAIGAAVPIDAAVGIWGYEGHAIAKAIAATNAEGKVTAVCFDRAPATLDAIRSGTIQATCALDPSQLAYQTLAVLRDLATTGDPTKLPPGGRIDVAITVIDSTNVDADPARPTTPPGQAMTGPGGCVGRAGCRQSSHS